MRRLRLMIWCGEFIERNKASFDISQDLNRAISLPSILCCFYSTLIANGEVVTVRTHAARPKRHVSVTVSGIPALNDRRVLQRQGSTSFSLLQKVILLSKKRTKAINIPSQCSNPIINASKNAEAACFINGETYHALEEYF